MNTKLAWSIVTILFVIIIILLWILVTVPAPAQTPVATSTTATSTIPAPLHERVKVTSPLSGASVGKNFTVTGEAPGNWYFEASFPVQVYDKDNNKLAGIPAQALSDWMTTGQVQFKADITLDGTYHGSATLVLLKDNPSGLPENDDSVSIPIVIQ